MHTSNYLKVQSIHTFLAEQKLLRILFAMFTVYFNRIDRIQLCQLCTRIYVYGSRSLSLGTLVVSPADHSSRLIGGISKLPPAVANMKNQAELTLHQTRSDCVMFNDGGKGGITDLSFEKRESKEGVKRVVSIHFEMDKEGVKSYRKAAAALADAPSVELHYTPHFGQSRITFEWDDFWMVLGDHKIGLMQSFPQLVQLPAPGTIDSNTKSRSQGMDGQTDD